VVGSGPSYWTLSHVCTVRSKAGEGVDAWAVSIDAVSSRALFGVVTGAFGPKKHPWANWAYSGMWWHQSYVYLGFENECKQVQQLTHSLFLSVTTHGAAVIAPAISEFIAIKLFCNQTAK